VRSIYIFVRSVHICIGCQILLIVRGNDKHAIVDALISSNNNIWPLFTMHPLHINMQAIRVDEDKGYADTDGQCQCLRDYHYECLMAMRNTNERNRINMRCTQCRRKIFGILDLERQNRYLSDEDEEICPICQDRLGREFELGKMRCTCTARFNYRCLHQYKNQRSLYDPDQNNGMKCVTCNGIAVGLYRIWR
jgi:hypothetical protein